MFYLLVERDVTIDLKPIDSYQFRQLRITFISSCATTLALIVALLKDEIRALWKYSKLSIGPQVKDFLIEDIDQISSQQDIRAISYQVVLVIKNVGSLAAKDCSIVITELSYEILNNGIKNPIDITTAKELTWLGKGKEQVLIPSNGGSALVSILQIEPNTASTAGSAQSLPTKLSIGGIDLTDKNNTYPIGNNTKWTTIFMIFSETSSPKKYKLEITWDRTWQNRKNEMMQHLSIKAI